MNESTPVVGSMLKRAMLRKDPTFSEATHGFRSFGELLRQLEAGGVIALAEGDAKGDPAVAFPATGGEDAAFAMLAQVVTKLGAKGKAVPLSGLKTQLRKLEPEFSEKRFGYSGFLQFARAATARGIVSMAFDDDSEDYLMTVPG